MSSTSATQMAAVCKTNVRCSVAAWQLTGRAWNLQTWGWWRRCTCIHGPDIFTQEQQQLSSIEVTGPAPAASCYALRVCSSGFPWTPLCRSFEEQLAQRNTRPLVLRTLTQKSFLRGSASAALPFWSDAAMLLNDLHPAPSPTRGPTDTLPAWNVCQRSFDALLKWKRAWKLLPKF